MTETLLHIWSKILLSNLFNFVVMVLLLGWLIKKFDIAGKLEQGRKNIEDRILLSNMTKENAVKELFETQSKTESVDNEVFEILERAEKNAVIVGERLVQEAVKQADEFDKNTKKAVDANVKALKISLTSKTADAAVKLAKKHIEDELHNNKDLHIKYINESIDALNGVEL
ncbi:MAG: ATP synthase F0 subunit B [Candidatus Gastranaerophilales bacterium]|nr:ATP synthase F0 subunit B [Candidatus Gastranaerophilales bacterium]